MIREGKASFINYNKRNIQNAAHKQKQVQVFGRYAELKSGRPSKETFSHIDLPSQNMEGDGLACSGAWVAFPWKVGGGGKIVVKRADQFGKCHSSDAGLSGHEGEILDLAFSPFNDFLLGSASLDGTIRLWELPVEGALTEQATESLTTLAGHSNKVQLIRWNTLANNILASGSAKGEVLVW